MVWTGMQRYQNRSIIWVSPTLSFDRERSLGHGRLSVGRQEILNEPGGDSVLEWYPKLVQTIGKKIAIRNLSREMLVGPAAGFNLFSHGDIDPRAFNTSMLELMFERGEHDRLQATFLTGLRSPHRWRRVPRPAAALQGGLHPSVRDPSRAPAGQL